MSHQVGAGDERGAANHMKPEAVLRAAARLIRTGEVIEVGRVLSPDIPLGVGRRLELYTKRTNGPLGANKRLVVSRPSALLSAQAIQMEKTECPSSSITDDMRERRRD